jgi:hypothetical protein
MQKISYSLEGLDLGVIPQAAASMGDAAPPADRSRLDEYQTRATEREAPKMDEVKIVKQAFRGAVHAHRRDDDAVLQRQPAEGRLAEEHRFPLLFPVENLGQWLRVQSDLLNVTTLITPERGSRAFPAKFGSPSTLYLFVFTQSRTQNRLALLLELLWKTSSTTKLSNPCPCRRPVAARTEVDKLEIKR